MRSAHLFAGAGGGILADEILAHNTLFALELDPQCCTNLRNQFPNVSIIQNDIKQFSGHQWAGRVDLLNAGIPCPEWSTARSGRGQTENLWKEVLRITSEIAPSYLFLECAQGFKREHSIVQSDLGRIGYSITKPLIYCASQVGAPHIRRRYWSLAYADNQSESLRPFNDEMAEQSAHGPGLPWETPFPPDNGVDDGMADLSYRYKAIGNGQCPLQAAAAYLILGGPVNL